MFLKLIFTGTLDNRIFNLPLQYRINKYRSRLLRTAPGRPYGLPGVSLFNHVFQIRNPPIGRYPPRHNLTGNVHFPGNPSNIHAGRY